LRRFLVKVKLEKRILLVVQCSGYFIAILLRGCMRIEKLFISLDLDELIANIHSSNILGENPLIATSLNLKALRAKANLPYEKLVKQCSNVRLIVSSLCSELNSLFTP
jgi:hypothetical protein